MTTSFVSPARITGLAAKIPTPADVAVAISINDSLDRAKRAVDRALDALSEAGVTPAEKPDFKLFEIRMENGVTKLVPVDAKVASRIIQQTTIKTK
jgi:hypothetical protein